MKALCALALLVVAAASVVAQPANETAGVQIVRVGLQRVIAQGPKMRAVAATDPASRTAQRADMSRDVDHNPALGRLSRDAEVAPTTSRSAPFGNLPTPPQVVFIASMVIKNAGTKTITAVHWEYLMFKTGQSDPVKTYRVRIRRRIPPGEQAELTKEVRPKGNEQQAKITRIEYADGSVWKAPPN